MKAQSTLYVGRLDKKSLDTILSKARKVGGLYVYESQLTVVYYPAQYLQRAISEIGSRVPLIGDRSQNPNSPRCPAEGSFSFDPSDWQGILDITTPQDPSTRRIIPSTALYPHRQRVMSIENFHNDKAKINFDTTDENGSNWSLHFG